MSIRKIIFGTCCALSIAAFGTFNTQAADTIQLPSSAKRQANIDVLLHVDSSCTVTQGQSIIFDSISANKTAKDDKEGSIIVNCTDFINQVKVNLKRGNNESDFSNALLKNGDSTIAYKVFTDEARQKPFSAGSESIVTVTPNTDVTIPVYAQLIGNQDVPKAGTYSDTITAEISW
jgi:spore coat protein U-like protein